jgi:hypothetical protein
MKTFKKVTTQELTSVVCDGCGLQASADGDYEFHEFISIKHHCGYSSIHGDGKQIGIDLCQQCFADMCGNTLRVTDESNNIAEENESSEVSPLEYSNIFDVICQSKAKAWQLKGNCDLRLAARDILLKNKVTNNNELTVALKRVELWDAQYLSAEGNELHQLADLICAYEKKDWNIFFEDAPLADDDFMPGRLSFKSKFTFDEEQTPSGMLSSISINTNIDDESSIDSALAGNKLDEAKQYLLESITNVLLKYPELRLGQLLINAMSIPQLCPEIDHAESPELFYVEDDILAEKLNLLS